MDGERPSKFPAKLPKVAPTTKVGTISPPLNPALIVREVNAIFHKKSCGAGNTEDEIVLAGQKILLTHGHFYKVKYSYDRLFYHAKECGATAALFGHTHRQYCEYEDSLWLVNPGSAGASPDGTICYATLLIGRMGVVPKLRTLKI